MEPKLILINSINILTRSLPYDEFLSSLLLLHALTKHTNVPFLPVFWPGLGTY